MEETLGSNCAEKLRSGVLDRDMTPKLVWQHDVACLSNKEVAVVGEGNITHAKYVSCRC